MRFVFPALGLLLAAATLAQAQSDRGPFSKIAVIHLREQATEAIDPSVKTSILRRLEAAREWGADCIVLDIESYGGLVHSSIETGDEIYHLGRTIHTIAYVERKAISGAAMLAISCREIVMNEVANLGDSQVIYAGSDGEMKIAPEKFQTTVAAKFRTYAKGNGYPVEVAEAMVRSEMEVTRYRAPIDPEDPSRGFELIYLRSDEGGSPPGVYEIEEWGWMDKTVVVPKGQLATFTSEEALEFGFCSRLEPDLQALLDSISDEKTEFLSLQWTWAENVSRWLLGMRMLLFLIGAGSLYFALKIPGTGVPEVMAIICFGLFFGASAVAGFVGPLEMILFLIGIVLIVVELFVIPGFGVAGVAGMLLIFASIALAAIPEGGLTEMPEGGDYGDYLLPLARDFLLAVLGSMAVVLVIARNLPKVPFFRGLALAGPGVRALTGSAVAATDDPAGLDSLVGERGVAETRLRPAGRARIGGKLRDVLAEGSYVEPGTEIKVVAVRGSVTLVRPVGESK